MAEVFDFGLQKHKIKMDGKFFESNLFAVAGDTGRRLEVQLLDSNNLVQNTTGISLRLNANVAGQATYAEATLVDATKGLYELDLPNGMLIAPGNWQFQWQIIGTTGEKLHSFAFMGIIGSNLSEGGSEATNFYLNANELKQMQDDLVNGTFNSEVLETNIAEKLNNLEDKYAPKLTEVTAQLEQTEARVDLINRGLGETFATFTELETAYPTGDTKDHIVAGNGHRYYWNETTLGWADGGAYQALEVASGAVGLSKLSTGLQSDIDYFNTFSDVPFTQNMGSFYSRFSGALTTSSFFEYTDITASSGDIFYVTLRTGSNVAGVIFRDVNGAVISMLYASGTDVVITSQKIVAPYGTARISLSSRNNTNPLQIKKADTFGQLKAGAIIGDKSITYTKMSDDLVTYLGHKPFGYIEKAAAVFVCDDGEQETLTYLPSISSSKKVPFVSACWNDSVILNASNLATTQGLISSNGWEIAMHYNSHLNVLTADQVLNIFETEKMKLTAKGLTIKNFVYPYNETTALLQLLCSKYFNIATAGTLSGPFKENKKRSNLFNMSRRKIQSSTGLGAYQAMIDGAIANKQILIFYFHGIELNTAENLTRLNEVIDYCKTKKMTVTTLQGLYDM